MRARCGRCGATVEVMGAGRFQCPACGTLNQVSEPPPSTPAPPPEQPIVPDAPSLRVACVQCGFSFIVGDVETAICPNCRSEVAVGRGAGTGDSEYGSDMGERDA